MRGRASFEDKIIFAIIVAVALFFLYWLVGCGAFSHKTATMKYSSKKDCEWYLAGTEVIKAENFETSFEVGPDCTLIRKNQAKAVELQEPDL